MARGVLLFPLGQLVLTRGVNDLVAESPPSAARDLLVAVRRHARGDWGDLDPEDKAENDHALGRRLRILSAYTVGGVKVWIITEADRSATTVLFPSEY